MSSENTPNSLYRECLRNHAASLGSYATDGCGEFTLDGGGSLQCAACGCHRNFHRKVTCPAPAAETMTTTTSAGDVMEVFINAERSSGGKKRFRTKFSEEQKEKMMEFAEKIGWKMQRKDLDDEIERFCASVGVTRQVFKVWMHNHKNSNSSSSAATANYSTGNASSLTQ